LEFAVGNAGDGVEEGFLFFAEGVVELFGDFFAVECVFEPKGNGGDVEGFFFGE
jgi:hypothetical protein